MHELKDVKVSKQFISFVPVLHKGFYFGSGPGFVGWVVIVLLGAKRSNFKVIAEDMDYSILPMSEELLVRMPDDRR